MSSVDILTPLFARQAPPGSFGPRQWEDLLGQARRARLLARLATLHEDHGVLLKVPEGPRRQLHAALRWMHRQHREVVWEVSGLTKALAGLSSPVVLLKGAAYLIAGLPPARGRLFADIDILIRHRELGEAEGALMSAGWISTERDAYNQRYYRMWMHELPPMRHVQRGSVIDVHHTITPPTSRFAVDGELLLDRLVPIDPARRLCVLAPEDMVLHSAAHLFGEGEFDHGLRDLLDLADLLGHFLRDPAFRTRLEARTDELRLQVPLFHALTQLHRLVGLDTGIDLMSLQPPWPQRAAMQTLLERVLVPDHPSCPVPGRSAAAFLMYVRAHWLRMPLHLVLPHLVRKAWMRRLATDPGELPQR